MKSLIDLYIKTSKPKQIDSVDYSFLFHINLKKYRHWPGHLKFYWAIINLIGTMKLNIYEKMLN